jgi:hypothetical protein
MKEWIIGIRGRFSLSSFTFILIYFDMLGDFTLYYVVLSMFWGVYFGLSFDG